MTNLRHALRSLLALPGENRRRGTLALGVAFTTTMLASSTRSFSAAAVPERSAVVVLEDVHETGGATGFPRRTSPISVRRRRRSSRATCSSARRHVRRFRSSGARERSPSFPFDLQVLGISPQIGRGFRADENEVVVLTTTLADEVRRRPDLGGKAVSIDGAAYTVVGVFPRISASPMRHGLWQPWSEGFERDSGSSDVLRARPLPPRQRSTARARSSPPSPLTGKTVPREPRLEHGRRSRARIGRGQPRPCGCSSVPRCSCWCSRARTWPTCCWPAPPHARRDGDANGLGATRRHTSPLPARRHAAGAGRNADRRRPLREDDRRHCSIAPRESSELERPALECARSRPRQPRFSSPRCGRTDPGLAATRRSTWPASRALWG